MMSLTIKQIEIIANMKPMLEDATWILRIAQHKHGLMWSICERAENDMRKRGSLRYSNARSCLDAIRTMLSNEVDVLGRPLEIQTLIDAGYIGDIPLSEEAGTKLALFCILFPKDSDAIRSELLAWRIERFSREEAGYWLSRATFPFYSKDNKAIAWAKDGLRTMLCGRGKADEELARQMLDVLRR